MNKREYLHNKQLLQDSKIQCIAATAKYLVKHKLFIPIKVHVHVYSAHPQSIMIWHRSLIINCHVLTITLSMDTIIVELYHLNVNILEL